MDLIDKRDEVLRIFLEYGITENTENDLTKTDLADCAEQIVKKLTIPRVSNNEVALIEPLRNFIRSKHLSKEWETFLKDYERNL